MTDKRTVSLAGLQPKAGAKTLKSEFFATMPAIEAALKRDVSWKAILADLEANGLTIKPETATNYAAQFRRRQRPVGVPGEPGRPRRSEVQSAEAFQTTNSTKTKTKPSAAVNDGVRLTAPRVASLRRPPDLA